MPLASVRQRAAERRQNAPAAYHTDILEDTSQRGAQGLHHWKASFPSMLYA